MSPLMSAMPPSGPTRLEPSLKSDMRGARARMLAMCAAPSLAVMLLNRCSWDRLEASVSSSATAAQAWMEQPTFLSDRLDRPACGRWAEEGGGVHVLRTVSTFAGVAAAKIPKSTRCMLQA